MIEKEEIGLILKRRIKEMGYTQEGFAEKVGINYETLKKYMRGECFYSIENLDILAKGLDCSYDYLLGKSKATKHNNHILVKELGLSNQAIETIKGLKNNSNSYVRENCFSVLDKVICNHDLIFYMTLYIMADKDFSFCSKETLNILMSMPLGDFNLDILKTFSLSMICASLGEMRNAKEGKFEVPENIDEMIGNGKE